MTYQVEKDMNPILVTESYSEAVTRFLKETAPALQSERGNIDGALHLGLIAVDTDGEREVICVTTIMA